MTNWLTAAIVACSLTACVAETETSDTQQDEELADNPYGTWVCTNVVCSCFLPDTVGVNNTAPLTLTMYNTFNPINDDQFFSLAEACMDVCQHNSEPSYASGWFFTIYNQGFGRDRVQCDPQPGKVATD